MPTAEVVLPNGNKVSVFFATGSDGWAGKYFNGKRLGFNGELTKQNYLKCIPALQSALTTEIAEAGFDFDAIVCPPSSGEDTEPYRDVIMNTWPVCDLTNNFTRKGHKKAAHLDTTLEDMIDEFIYSPIGNEDKIRSVLIIDESMASGKTTAAIIHHLRMSGLPHDAHIAVAACVKVAANQ